MKTKTNVFVLFWVRNIYHVVHVLHVVVEELFHSLKNAKAKNKRVTNLSLERLHHGVDGAG